MSLSSPHWWRIQQARHVIQQGGIIAYPTEGVYGLGCNPFNEYSVEHLLQLKQRSASKGLIVLFADLPQLLQFTPLTRQQQDTLIAHQDQHISWIIEDNDNHFPLWVKGRFNSVAIRITKHPMCRQLCLTLKTPLVSTSANISGRNTIRTPFQLRKQFGQRVDYILPGTLLYEGNRASEIRHIDTGQTVRTG